MDNHDHISKYIFEGNLLKILTFPHAVLAKVAEPVTVFDENLRLLCKNMLYTMYRSPGVGLAAPQVGIGLRLFVIDVEYERKKKITSDGKEDYELSNFDPQIFINPKIKKSEGSIVYQEGCLSLPGIYEEVQRSHNIEVEYFNLDGEPKTMRAEDLLSVCIQHENDHLDGIVLLDRLSQLKRNLLKKRLIKQKKVKK